MTASLDTVRDILQRSICAVVGHQTLLQFEHHRLSLRCVACGHETTGWTIGEPPSRSATSASPSRIETSHAA